MLVLMLGLGILTTFVVGFRLGGLCLNGHSLTLQSMRAFYSFQHCLQVGQLVVNPVELTLKNSNISCHSTRRRTPKISISPLRSIYLLLFYNPIPSFPSSALLHHALTRFQSIRFSREPSTPNTITNSDASRPFLTPCIMLLHCSPLMGHHLSISIHAQIHRVSKQTILRQW